MKVYLMKKVFHSELVGKTLIVIPQGAAMDFPYQQVHIDSNATLRLLSDPSTKNVLIDLGDVEYLDSIIIGSLIRMLQKIKTTGGQAMFCSATEQMQEILKSIKIGSLWPLHPDREVALAAMGKAEGC
ncbi:hypothetical protein MNBD_PLANCTO02-2320 [hydrothermal vent metagenome]|uniref:STAS domain-containing protein n=1 Tax=hydrothermal vent metagenome TaxID=652676 RepID=A0A3B1DK42_9ZZZZ